MPHPLRLVLALHNHQPIGNFDHVVEQAYQDSYRPFLDVVRRYPELKWSLHTSGSLAQWLDAHHPEYLDALAEEVAAGRLEIIGGAFYEPILAMLPPRDRIGQIQSYTRWLEDRLGARVRGMWIPERVWEQNMAADVADARIEYTILDDFHFRCAGLVEDQLHGYYLTEDNGRLLKVFPGSEKLRYTIPFASPQATIDYLRQVAESREGAVVVFGDDGEKFGTWPDTKRHVYDNGWLAQFFEAVLANGSWLHTALPGETIDVLAPAGKVYLPDASYREMTEWALPSEQLVEYGALVHEGQSLPEWPRLSRFLRGGNWRNFKVKYSEADEMYARMLDLSGRLELAAQQNQPRELIDQARSALYRAQCNCSYWHGAFGGIYLPHLRNAVYANLIEADNLLERAAGREEAWAEISSGDYNLDARPEVQLAGDKLVAWFSPARGGQLYEFDVRSTAHNLLATLRRRPEAYHAKVLSGAQQGHDQAASIHDRVVFKQEGLDQRLQYDAYAPKSLLDHFFDNDASLEQVASGKAMERGDFLAGAYEARLRRAADRCQLVLSREGNAWGFPLRLTKSITLAAGTSALEIVYQFEGLPQGHVLHFAPEFQFAGLPSGADDRYFFDVEQRRLGHLGTRLDLHGSQALGLADHWLGMATGLRFNRPTSVWTYPVETVSQSEGGFELVHQSVAVIPHWLIEADSAGRWSVGLSLFVDTQVAENRRREAALAAAR